ncbi:MAG: putative anti-sigma factor antagonist [Myxococcales bacterium]|nr:putative anti-sigma factor antagonist [Myxococcales bacterium]
MFQFERTEREGVTVLTLSGNLDAATAGGLKQEVIALSELKTTRVAVELSKITLIDSTGVGVLISLFKRTRAQGGQVHFAGLTGQPKEIFRLLRLDRSLDLHPTLDEALTKLKG